MHKVHMDGMAKLIPGRRRIYPGRGNGTHTLCGSWGGSVLGLGGNAPNQQAHGPLLKDAEESAEHYQVQGRLVPTPWPANNTAGPKRLMEQRLCRSKHRP